ncbi:MAG: DUF262 domain-containing protein, partial [Candidatus Enterosoma sp.]|nr:DUF262 domain-containing protein [bacterium]MDY5547730.1 DUF262 domain-containing protein [Candidatus Enterosoma sp.]
MDNKIISLSILDDSDKTLFDKDKYIIPLYQRAFAWSDKEICQLIDDINDFTSAHYYLGSLIVNLNKDGVYEVIDGQQRLTALFLLLDFVGKNDWGDGRLSYECRERSNFTLNNLSKLNNDTLEVYLANSEKIEQTLIAGRKIISDKFSSDKIDENQFIAKLKNVILYRIEVPPHTDLNRYFEIMNVRGEQLEQHDILKARLMEPLDEKSRATFAIVWDACRDMTGYVQMHFQKDDRETLFRGGWDQLNLDKYDSLCKKKDITLTSLSVVDIIKQDTLPYTIEGYDESGTRVRFDSIIGFPHFLLHVLKVFASTELDKDSYSIPELLDDKKLLEIFTSVINSAKQNDRQVDKKYFSQAFIKCLLKCRFLFDKYIIKREYKNEDEKGDWSLKELKVSGAKSQKKPYYKDTYFGEHNEWEKTYAPRTRINLMLQSCMCVSYTSPKTMHWITELLSWLYDDTKRQNLSSFQGYTEKIAKDEVKSFIKNKDNYRQGVKTPHIVLNYLDYLLWTKRNEKEYQNLKFDQFSFEYRNSVEHWYPQHPSKESFVRWDDFDRFGNLCIIQ